MRCHYKRLSSALFALLGLYLLFGGPELQSYTSTIKDGSNVANAARWSRGFDSLVEEEDQKQLESAGFYKINNHQNAADIITQSVSPEAADANVLHESSSKDHSTEFPRILHYIWPDKNFSSGFDDNHELERIELLNRVNTIKSLNPNWQIRVWTDDDCEELIQQRFADFYPVWKSKLKPRLKMWDAVRPAILYMHGGIYLDHDVSCAGVGFEEWILPANSSSSSSSPNLLVRTTVTYPRSIVLGNNFMGSIRGHEIWQLYIANIIKDVSSKRRRRTVTGHTGPGQFGRTFRQYMKLHPDELNGTAVRVLQLNELANEGECEDSELYGSVNASLCEIPRCIHEHGISPAEIAGEDDNAASQLAASKARNEAWRGNITITSETGADETSHKYTVPKCDPCNRMKRFKRSTKGKVIFVHIPKTAGSTIEYILGIGGSCHATAAALAACNPDLYESALTFTIIRHPFDRAVSMYDYAKAGGNGKDTDISKYAWVSNSTTFDEFVSGLDPYDYSYAPMSHYISSESGSTIILKEVLCFDDLSAGWDRLASKVPSLKRGRDGRQVNVTAIHRRSGQHDIISVEKPTLDKLRDYYQEDYVLWDRYCSGRESQILH